MSDPEYLGDAVYALHDGYHVWLRLNSYENMVGQIAMEPAVMERLIDYWERHLGGAKQ